MKPTARQVIAFDADDTLWHNETIFEKSHSDFADLLAPYVDLSARDRKSTRLNSSHVSQSRMPSSA